MSEILSPEQKAARRAEVLKLYRETAPGPERDKLYWETPELQEIYSQAMHAKPAAESPKS